MTQEDKDLLLKYLCMALPYGVKCILSEYHIEEFPYNGTYCDKVINLAISGATINLLNHIEKYGVKPYLRPMSSMTDEEKKELLNLLFDKEAEHFYIDKEGLIDGKPSNLFKDGLNYPSFYPVNIVLYTNWLLKHHFDFMGLIPKGLAIEVKEENNPYKE